MAHPPTARRLLIFFLVLVLVCLAGLFGLHWRREHLRDELRDRQVQRVERGPKLYVAAVQATPPVRDVTLPGEVRAFEQTTLYSKIAGYVKRIHVDKGDTVKAGQLLATIASPETDREVAAARSDFAVRQRLYLRTRTLLAKGYISQQEVDNAHAAAEVARATLQRTEVLRDYEQLRAPFAGTITARYVDAGALLPAPTGSTGSALPLVDVADLTRVRVAVFAGQDVAPHLTNETKATVVQDERPGLKIEANLSRISGALDPRARTMLTEVWLDNRRYALQPGTFVHVTLHVRVPPLPTIPSEALVIRNAVPQAAVVRDGHLQFVKVEPGLDDGVRVQIRSGLEPGQIVALSVPADLETGAPIQPVAQPGKPPARTGPAARQK